MAWIESHQSLSKHRKTLAVVSALRVDRHKVIGHLHELWWWALDNARSDGLLGHVPHQIIAEAAGWPIGQASRFVGALLDAGFLEQTDEGLVIHDWYDFAGKLSEQRELRRESNRKAQSVHRQRLGSADSQQASALTEEERQHLRSASVSADNADSKHSTVPNPTVPNPTVPNPTVPNPTQPAGEPRLARPARTRAGTRGGLPRLVGNVLAEHQRRLAEEQASQAMPGQPEKSSLNGDERAER